MVNKFPVLIRTVQDIQNGRKGLRIFREELTPPAKAFNTHIINWLQNKSYPLRKGSLSNATSFRTDELYNQTPTERLHPGSPSLWAAQRFRIRKIRGVMSQRVIFENLAEHARYFFKELKSNIIEHTDPTKRLKFWSGNPLPWQPPKVRQWSSIPGAFYPKAVEHPGHMDYGKLVKEIFNTSYKNMFINARRRAAKKVGSDSIRKALQ